ncbi:hypothetical protein [Paenibacillus sp. FSL H8-0175]|nr:hypothetical protein BSK50_11275 [Paenibacillus odorifer]OMD82737.1 hypothetical protein BSK53_16070 [Paenibacillus odorifer]
MKIQRIALNLTIMDQTLLDTFKRNSHRVVELIFKSTGDDTIVEGKTISTSDHAAAGYMYIDYHIPEIIGKVLSIHKGIDNYYLMDPHIELTNRTALIASGVSNYIMEKLYGKAELVKKAVVLPQNEFIDSINMLNRLSTKDKIDDVLFFMHLSNTVNQDKRTYTSHDIINRFRYIWSAFNALYEVTTTANGDKASIVQFSKKRDVIAFINSGYCREYLDSLKSANLELRNSNNVSLKLKDALHNNNNEAVSENALLCAYAIRNSNFHGTNDETTAYCRIGYELIHSLIKFYLPIF